MAKKKPEAESKEAKVNEVPIDYPRVKRILISQPEPENGKSPFYDIGEKFKAKVDFRSFIEVKGVTTREFRRLRINLNDFSAVILNSRTAIDHFFAISEALRHRVSQDLKFFCTSEAIALYLQKYTQYRKRKVFFETSTKSLFDILKKHKENENFLYPCSNIRKDDIPNYLKANKFKFQEAILYNTVPSDLSDLVSLKYDLIVFFSPMGVTSLFHNYPDFVQEDRRIAGFGKVTQDAINEAGLRCNIIAPAPDAPSMAQAIENYLLKVQGK